MLPVGDRLVVACGAIVFPLLGVLAAFSFVLLDHFFRRQWTQWVLMALYVLIILWAFSSLVAPRFISGPSPRANHTIERMGAVQLGLYPLPSGGWLSPLMLVVR